MKYLLLLRGINVGGNSKVSMADLRTALEKSGFHQVRTYINSGNVLFESDDKDTGRLVDQAETTIKKTFGFAVDCVVIAEETYKNMVDSAPAWWGTADPTMRSDALFILRRGTAKAIVDKVGAVNDAYEWIDAREGIVYWTIDRRHYGKARLPKIIGSDEYKTISMRSSTTTRKLYALLTDS